MYVCKGVSVCVRACVSAQMFAHTRRAHVKTSRRDLENAWPGIFLSLLEFCEATDYSAYKHQRFNERNSVCAPVFVRAYRCAYALACCTSWHPVLHGSSVVAVTLYGADLGGPTQKGIRGGVQHAVPYSHVATAEIRVRPH